MRRRAWWWAGAALLAVSGAFAAIAPHGNAQSAGAGAKVALHGAGATFPAPLYRRWIDAFAKDNPGVAIDYQDVGSGEGIRRFLSGSIDFGASDGALSDEQMARVGAGARLVPATAGLVVLAYNVPGLRGTLRLSREVYAGIFSRAITNWSDARIRAANPDLALPNRSITLVARQDGSGTTFALTNHLSAISPAWRDQGPGIGYLVNWSGKAMLAKGNEGVASKIKLSEGAIGYVEYGFARRLGLSMAALENRAGRYILPGEPSGRAALAANAGQMPSNLRLFLPDPEGPDSYPIVSFSWILLYERYQNQDKGAALKRFVTWGLSDGQQYGPDLGYIALPPEVVSLARAAVERVQ